MTLAFDSDGVLDPQAAKDAGAFGLGGYLDGNLTAEVAEAAEEAGIWLYSFWEGQAGNPNLGSPQGYLDADSACNDADDAGQPVSVAVTLPNDQMVEDWTPVLEYFETAAATIRIRGRVPGFYGQESVWQQVKGYGYQFYVHAHDGTPGPWPEANVVQGVADERQVGGMLCDVDEVQSTGCGFWNASGPYEETKPDPPKPPVPPVPIDLEDTMLIFNIEGQPNRVLTTAGTSFDLADEESKAFLVKYFGAKLAPGCGEPTVEAPDAIPDTLLAVFKSA
jgi:Domain of unknown function (DUF1906)